MIDETALAATPDNKKGAAVWPRLVVVSGLFCSLWMREHPCNAGAVRLLIQSGLECVYVVHGFSYETR